MSDTSGKSLIEFWTWAAEKGLMNQNTAIGIRAAVTKVLSIEEKPDEVDISTLKVDDALKRFENLKKKDFTPGSLETYKQRFRQAIKSYGEYLDDPGGWRWASRTGPADKNGNGAKPKKRARTATPAPPPGPDPAEPTPLQQRGKVIDFQLPLRDGVIAHLWLPADLKPAEVKRLHAYMTTLVMEPGE